MRLEDKLKNIDRYPFHMPGHKRNGTFNLPSSDIDITEIDGFDNLHNPDGIIKNIEDEMTSFFNSRKTFLLVNGSTCGVLAAVFALCNENDTVIIARNCHKSVYNACYIRRLKVKYIYPKEYDFGCGAITQSDIDNAVKDNPSAKAIIITSPTYEGIVSRVKSPIPLIIDSAHGSHFGLGDYLPKRQNGDIIINSLHKTLPCLTQTASISIYNNVYTENIKKYIDIFETSSPSYILMSSVSRCMDYLKSCNNDYKRLYQYLCDTYDTLKKCKNLTYCNTDTNGGFEQDVTRISIGSKKSITGQELASILRDKYHIEPEMVTADYVVLIATVADTKAGFDMLKDAIKGIDKMLNTKESKKSVARNLYSPNKKALETFEIQKTAQTALCNSIGKISGEYLYAYPPGIPIIVPGEVIEQRTVSNILEMQKSNINLIGSNGFFDNVILTKSQD